MPKPTKGQLEAMRKLGMTDEEIADVIAYDEQVEKGGKTAYDLTAEQQKVAKAYTKADRKKTAPTVYKLDNENGKRNRKENPTKEGIIQHLFECLSNYDNVIITNKGRQIAFSVGENNFELTLVQKRAKK